MEASNAGRGGDQAGAPLRRHVSDLKTMYDLLGHRRLIARARALGMPREVAMTTLSSYRWPRFVVADTLVHPAILPNRGVVPGCPGACTWAKVALINGMDDCAQAYAGRPGVSLNAHVDDITVGCVGNTRAEVVGLVAEVMESLGGFIDVELKGQVAIHKAMVTASSPALAEAVKRAVGPRGGKAV